MVERFVYTTDTTITAKNRRQKMKKESGPDDRKLKNGYIKVV